MRQFLNKIISFFSNLNKPFQTTIGVLASIVAVITFLLQLPDLVKPFDKEKTSSTVKPKLICENVFKDSSNYRILVLPFFKTCETGRDVGLEIKNRLEILKYKDSLSLDVCYLHSFKQDPNFTKEQADQIRRDNNADQIIYGVNSAINCTPQDTLLDVCVNYLVDKSDASSNITPLPINQIKASISEIRQGFLQANIDYIVYYFSAVSDYEKGKFQQGLYKLSKIVNRNKNGAYNYLKGLLFEQMGKVDSARYNYNVAIKYDPQPSYLIARAGINRIHFKMYQASLDDCMQIIRSTKDTSLITPALFEITIDKYLLNDYKGAIAASKAYARYTKSQKSSNLAYSYQIRGMSYNSIDKIDSALIFFNAAIKADKDFSLPLYTRAVALYSNYDYNEALKDFNALISKDKTSDDYYIGRAKTYFKIGNLKESEKDYINAQKFSKNKVDTYLKIAEAKRDNYEYWDSMKILNNLLKENDNNYNVHYHLGITYSDLHNNLEAVKHYKTCLRLNPDFKDALFNMAVLQYEIGDFSESIKSISEYIKVNPVSAKSYYWRGLSKLALNDNTALSDIEKASKYGNVLAGKYLKSANKLPSN